MKEKLNDLEISELSEEQRVQVEQQWKASRHAREETDLPLSPFGDVLKGFIVHENVWHPAKMSSRYYASYLFFNNERLYAGKNVLEVGTGTGLMGIVMGLNGAKKVVLTDISEPAVNNAIENTKKFNVEDITEVVLGDLFENVPKEKFDFIVFNHPFFPGNPEPGDTISASMLNSGELMDRFLEEVKDFLAPGGKILMPYYKIAGPRNDPMVQGPKHGFEVTTTFSFNASRETQQGALTVHELTLKRN